MAAVLDGGELGFHQALAARAEIDVVIEPVELQIESVQARFLGGLRELEIREADAVGGRLNVGEAELRGLAQHVHKARIESGLAAGKLHHAVGHGPLRAQALKHGGDLLEGRLVEIPGHVGVGKTDRAGQVAAIGQIHVGKNRVRGVQRAEAAVVRTARGVGDGGILQTAIVAEFPLLHFEVEARVGVDLVAKFAMRNAGLFHINRAVLFEQPRIDHLKAFRADRLRRLRQPFLKGFDGCTRESGFGLDDFEFAPTARFGGRSYRQSGHNSS